MFRLAQRVERPSTKLFILDNSCGHSVHACPDNGMSPAILEFLKE
jgi:hypothetical protein